MERVEPLVTVVIPTRNRPQLVVRAVQSALSQTVDAIEVVVIQDGPNQLTLEALREIDDPRVRVKVLPRNMGTGFALNAGIGEARCQWVAFLDDDDEWFPEKLENQLEAARHSCSRYPIIGCRFIARSERADVVWPRRFPRPNESMSEYLFCRTSLFAGEGIIQTSTIFTVKELLQRVPFKEGHHRHVDIDWLLRATRLDGVGVQSVPTPEPLAIWHREETHNSISRNPDWRFSLDWINQNKHLVTPRAYASFLMTWLSANAVREGDRKAFLLLLREAYQYGKPTVLDALLFLGIWLMPRGLRQRIAAVFADSYRFNSGSSPIRSSHRTRTPH